MCKRIILPFLLLFALLLSNPSRSALSKSPSAFSECPPASTAIWVQGQGDVFPENQVIQVPFEAGTFTYGNATLTNYLAGVLEQEIGGTAETPLNNWQQSTAQAVAVAARTAAYAGCYRVLANGQHGVYEDVPQVYNPGHSAARAQEYRDFVQQTAGQYLSHADNNNSYFDLQYRAYVGRQTNDRAGEEQTGPHKSVIDPVGANDEGAGTGMGQHSANHWVLGLHNERLGEPVNVSNVRWTDYRQILTHYYTGVHLRNANGGMLTPDYRWNLLQYEQTGPLIPNEWTGATIVIQNTGTATIPNNEFAQFGLVGAWCDADDHGCPTRAQLLQSASNGLPQLEVGDVFTVTEVHGPPDGGNYRLVWDICTVQFEGPPEDFWCFAFPAQGALPWVLQESGTLPGVVIPTATPLPTATFTPLPPTATPTVTITAAATAIAGTPPATVTPAPGWAAVEMVVMEGAPPKEILRYSRLLSNLRDRILLADARGKVYVELTYRHAPELMELMQSSPKLRARVKTLALLAQPGLEEWLQDPTRAEWRVNARWRRQLNRTLRDLGKKASPELRSEIEWWRARLPSWEDKTLPQIWESLLVEQR